MNAVLGELPSGDDWSHELKWDGVRLQVTTGLPGGIRLWSRTGRDVTATYPELTTLGDHLPLVTVLDGEAVVFDGDRPSFGHLQHRMHVADPAPTQVADHPVVLMVFDLLHLDGNDLFDLPLHQRRRLLEEVVDDGPAWRVPPVSTSGTELLALARDRGLEGVMSKRRTSTYQPGVRSRQWIKVKVRHQQEFVVGGWLPGQGNLAGSIGSLLLGVWEGRRLRFAGAAGSGLTDPDRARLADLLRPSDACPFDPAPAVDRPPVWVAPEAVVEVSYGWWPEDGNLRHPVYVGLRIDHPVADVVREMPPRDRNVE